MKLHKKIYSSILFLFITCTFCIYHNAEAFTCGTDTVPYGGKNYQTVQIGTQCWLKENLNIGTMLANESTMPSNNSVIEKWCYNNDTNICNTDGGLYTWAEANQLDPSCNTTSCTPPTPNQGICPTGWHIPSDDEFKTLELYVDIPSNVVDNYGWRGTIQSGLLSLFTLNGTGTNTTGFSGLLSGLKGNASFGGRTVAGYFWTSKEYSTVSGKMRLIHASNGEIYRWYYEKFWGHSVRCIMDTPQTPSLTTITASNIDQWNATLSGNITNIGQDNPERIIQLTPTQGNYTSPSECIAGTGVTGSYSCTISNLTPNTTYYYRAKATNSAGTSYGNELSFTTLALQDTTITDPDPTQISNNVSDGYFTLNTGSITDTSSVTTSVNITVQDTIFETAFPTNTTITGDGSFNFQNFIATNVSQTIKNDQPTSVAAIRFGIPNEQLSFSQNITVTVNVPQAFNTQTLDILYQQEGESTWHTHGTCTITNGQCTFQTNHATIYTINGIHQATGDTPMNLNVEVQETLSMDCFDPSDSNTTVSLGTSANPGLITAGTPAVGQSRCTVTTNADQGYYLTVENSNPLHATLTHADPNTGTLYEIADVSAWDESTKTTSTWIAPTTKGLAFSVVNFPETDTAHNQFDGAWTETGSCPEGVAADTNNYAGIPVAPQTISAVTSYQASATTTDICYKVDVPASQPSGQYAGQVTFTATSDASGYYVN